MNIKNLKRIIPLVIGFGVILFLFVFFITTTWIGYGVRERCDNAVRKYGGECVEALMDTVSDEGNEFRERNSAVWALGQLGDDRALSLLESYFIEVPEGREPIDEVLSQYELSKAIKLLKGGFNMGAWVWR